MKSCLVIDDEAMNRYAYVAMLETFGITIYEADNAIKALVSCEDNMPDIILLDWKMPKVDGLDFLWLLRKLKNGDRPYVIICSSMNRNSSIENDAIKAGANLFVQKPVRLDALRGIFRDAGII